MIGLLMLATAQFPVIVALGSGYPCQIVVDGIGATEAELPAVLKEKRKAARRAIIRYARNAPYRCIGGSFYLLQRAGFRKIELDPPLAGP